MRIKVFSLSLSLSTWYQSQVRKLYSFWFTRVINFENPSTDCVSFRSPFPSPKAFRSVISWSENPHHRQHFFGDIFWRHFFPVIFSDIDHIIRSAKRRFATFLKASEPKTDPRDVFLRQPESHAPTREGAWPTFWCWASTSRLVRRSLAHLSLCQSSPNPASKFFWHFNLRGSSFSLLRSPTAAPIHWLRLVCALGRPLLHLQSLFSFVWVPTYQVLLPQLWSDLPLGLSLIQTWFNLRWSGYGD